MIITVSHTKGGVGKTTTAINIAASFTNVGRDVLLIDGDRQGTAQAAISIRMTDERRRGIAVAQYTEGKILRSQIQQQRGKYSDIIIDAGGRDSTSLRAALVLTDVVLVPFQPKSFDVWALADISDLLREARNVRDGLQAYAFLNMAEPSMNSTDNADAVAAVSDWPELQLLTTKQEKELIPVILVRRKIFGTAASLGLSVNEMKPKDLKACDELNSLINALL